MKKLVAVVLLLAMIAPAAVLAEEISNYYGYAHIGVERSGAPVMYVIYLREDYTCYYLAQVFGEDKPLLGRAYVGTWGYTKEGNIHAVTGENTEITFTQTSFGSLCDLENMEIYEQIDCLMH